MDVNRRILEAIEQTTFPKEIKTLLKTLLLIELKNIERGDQRYTEEYDRVIKQLSGISILSEDTE